jgi:hypothetical protein
VHSPVTIAVPAVISRPVIVIPINLFLPVATSVAFFPLVFGSVVAARSSGGVAISLAWVRCVFCGVTTVSSVTCLGVRRVYITVAFSVAVPFALEVWIAVMTASVRRVNFARWTHWDGL